MSTCTSVNMKLDAERAPFGNRHDELYTMLGAVEVVLVVKEVSEAASSSTSMTGSKPFKHAAVAVVEATEEHNKLSLLPRITAGGGEGMEDEASAGARN